MNFVFVCGQRIASQLTLSFVSPQDFANLASPYYECIIPYSLVMNVLSFYIISPSRLSSVVPSDELSRIYVPPCGRGTVVSIVSCRCTYCCVETSHGKITIDIIHDIVVWHFATCTSVNCLTCVLVIT